MAEPAYTPSPDELGVLIGIHNVNRCTTGQCTAKEGSSTLCVVLCRSEYTKMEIYYVTNRRHEGPDRWHPVRYGKDASNDGMHNLRYGVVSFDLDSVQVEIDKAISQRTDGSIGNGNSIAQRVKSVIKYSSTISAFQESPDGKVRGSSVAYEGLQNRMLAGADVLVYVHGFNNDWEDAVSSAAALQIMLNAPRGANATAGSDEEIVVVLFTWPSDGQMLLYVPYFMDRDDASHSRFALCRALLSLQSRLESLRRETIQDTFTTYREYKTALVEGRLNSHQVLCNQGIHLLCHSMGSYVLECALEESLKNPDYVLADRMFEQVFLCAPDVTTDALEPGKPLSRLTNLCQNVTVYFNKQDAPLFLSTTTKHARERLGRTGVARPSAVDRTFMQVDCSAIVSAGIAEHTYFMNGLPLLDMRDSILGKRQSKRPYRQGDPVFANVWRLKLQEDV